MYILNYTHHLHRRFPWNNNHQSSSSSFFLSSFSLNVLLALFSSYVGVEKTVASESAFGKKGGSEIYNLSNLIGTRHTRNRKDFFPLGRHIFRNIPNSAYYKYSEHLQPLLSFSLVIPCVASFLLSFCFILLLPFSVDSPGFGTTPFRFHVRVC